MGFLFVVFLAMVAVSKGLHCRVGPLPQNDPPIDMSKFPGTWYESLTTLDPISMVQACKLSKDIKVTPSGIDATTTIYYDDAPTKSFPIYMERTENGNFRQIVATKANVLAHEEGENGNINLQAKSEYEAIEYKEYSLIGDPNHYIGFVSCDPSGWIVWVHTKERAITAENLVYVHNDLLKRGISVPFRLGRCQEVLQK